MLGVLFQSFQLQFHFSLTPSRRLPRIFIVLFFFHFFPAFCLRLIYLLFLSFLEFDLPLILISPCLYPVHSRDNGAPGPRPASPFSVTPDLHVLPSPPAPEPAIKGPKSSKSSDESRFSHAVINLTLFLLFPSPPSFPTAHPSRASLCHSTLAAFSVLPLYCSFLCLWCIWKIFLSVSVSWVWLKDQFQG